MPRARLISPEFWTSEAIVDCAPMTRLLLLGLSNFADDFGVQPLRPRTLRLQIFPGDEIDDVQVRAMIDELVAHGLVRRYTVDDVEYLSIVDWEFHQRVGKRARRRYPVHPSLLEGQGPQTAPIEKGIGDSEADQGLTASLPPPDNREPEKSPSAALRAPSPSGPSAAPDLRGEKEEEASWAAAVEGAVRRNWGADVPAGVALHAARWRAEGRDLARDVLPAIERVVQVAIEFNKPLRLELVDGAMARPTARVA